MPFFCLFFACTTQSTPSSQMDTSLWVGSFQSCAQYEQRDVLSYCIYQNASSLYTVEEVNRYCSLATHWEEGCRYAWAANRVKQAKKSDFDTLIIGCAGFSDCAMEIIDTLPTRDIDIQRKRCETYVQNDQEDCLRHTMQMWVNTNPTKETASLFLSNNPYLSDIEIQYVAELSYCQKWDICSNKTNNQIKCRSFIKERQKTGGSCRTNWGKQAPPP